MTRQWADPDVLYSEQIDTTTGWALMEDNQAIAEALDGANPAETLVITGTQVSAPKRARVVVDTDGVANAVLNKISVDGTVDGMIVYLRRAAEERSIAVEASQQLTGIRLGGDTSLQLRVDSWLPLRRVGDNWERVVTFSEAVGVLPEIEGGFEGRVLTVGMNGAEWGALPPMTAENVEFDPTTSELDANTVQGALAEGFKTGAPFAPARVYVEVAAGTSGSSHIAPGDGYFLLAGSAPTVGKHANVRNIDNNYSQSLYTHRANLYFQAMIPVGKGDTAVVAYEDGMSVVLRFIYSKFAERNL